GHTIPESIHRIVIRIRMTRIRGITLPKCRMVDVFNWQMNPLNFVWDECLRILLTAFHFRQGPHIDDGFHAVIKHLIPTNGINPFKLTDPPYPGPNLPSVSGPGSICRLKILTC